MSVPHGSYRPNLLLSLTIHSELNITHCIGAVICLPEYYEKICTCSSTIWLLGSLQDVILLLHVHVQGACIHVAHNHWSTCHATHYHSHVVIARAHIFQQTELTGRQVHTKGRITTHCT